ncbi:AzlD domain-containing protein [Rhodopseudomonas sp. BR0M22]|uniref:AzlD family protein n=1 Tax=Rhodopseudomonas sp. BR0M22 TaxID=2269369 RepID=UPI0013E06415|nr:AzlD domain-containing protein [Rhodopseudomonas sp. BR0M22]NEW92475.1 AzlD domain-containing protein [Rhodopseudomonas sp. BR0M22]
MTDMLRSDVMIAFAVMTAVTVASRLGGYFMMRYVEVTPRVRRMLDALPGSIIVAAALPVAVNGGPIVMVALAAAIAVSVLRRNDFLAVITGMLVAALARALGLPG